MTQVPNVPISTSYFPLAGGLNLVTPALSIPPGMCIDAQNFMPEITGGYKRIGGYERFDGHASPSAADYYVFSVTLTGTIAVGATITGASSGQTAVVIAAPDSTHRVVARVSGSFTNGETLNVGGVGQGTLTATPVANNESTPALDVSYANLAADEIRTSISAVPGQGPIRGVWVYNDVVYAFRDAVGGATTEMFKSTASGWSASLHSFAVPGGRFEFVNYNFSGSATGLKMYGCDGKNKAWEYDGTTFTSITSTASTDTPQCIAAHKNRLFLGVQGSLFLSSPGAPTSGWANTGGVSGEIGVGDQITGLYSLPGDNNNGALAVFSRNSTHILYGYSTSTWNLSPTAPDSGAIAHTSQYVSAMLALDDRGVTLLAASAVFSNFEQATISRNVQPFITQRAGTAVASSVLRSQNQYRLYFSDGYGLAFQVENSKCEAVMPIYYPNPVTCICTGEYSTGEEVVFFGSSDGKIYQAEKGTSFDGANIESWIRLAFNPEKSPRVRKRWRRMVCDVSVPGYAELNFTYEMDFGDYGLSPAITQASEIVQTVVAPGGGGFWDSFTWDNFTWDSDLISPPRYDLTGTGRNISLLFYNYADTAAPFTLQGITLHFTPRRNER